MAKLRTAWIFRVTPLSLPWAVGYDYDRVRKGLTTMAKQEGGSDNPDKARRPHLKLSFIGSEPNLICLYLKFVRYG